MNAPAFLLSALLAIDGGTPRGFDGPLYRACPEAPPMQRLDGGVVLMPPERAARVACLMETCEAHRVILEEYRKDEPPPPLLMAFLAGLVLAGVAGFTVGRYSR